jgi:hypothetical protein
VCVTECDQYNNNQLHGQWVGRNGLTKKGKERKKKEIKKERRKERKKE